MKNYFNVLFTILFPFFGLTASIAAKPVGISRDSTNSDSLLAIYRGTEPKINDLIHTKLEVGFDYARHYLMGKEWVTLKPHFKSTDSLNLDAKGMEIHLVSLMEGNTKRRLEFIYKGDILKIKLGRQFIGGKPYTVYIEYTAKPDQIKQKGSAAITSAKGLYFINSDGKNPDKPIQIWTQGETESSSCWFPTIDNPNQKTTDEITMTVPARFTTLSNGKLILQKKNLNGTRSDTWKMDLPHAPYLFMMAVGDFKIYHDHWKNKEVNYYLEPKYAPFAKDIFGKTPEMLSYYSKITGIDFPWNKYSQVVVRDYVSGAMENTSATLHGESVQKTARELLDENSETIICHELFHQWFGDYVTCESWSNITLNESFATLSEILWTGHDLGKDAEDAERYDKLHTYLSGTQNGKSPSLVRYHYRDREDVFDNVSYPKGSVILYALKNRLGDDIFFAGLNLYLKTNAFKSAEVSELRLAFEQVSGLDLHEYFDQWYYGSGHPILDIQSQFTTGKILIKTKQIQDSSQAGFQFPLKVAVWVKGKKEIQTLQITQRNQNFELLSPIKPDFIDFDVDKILVGEIRDHKSTEEFVLSYDYAPSFANRTEAIEACLKDQSNSLALKTLLKALNDPSYQIRKEVVEGLDFSQTQVLSATEPELLKMASKDPKTLVRSASISKLSETGNKKYISLCNDGLKSQSYAILGSSLNGLLSLDPDQGQKYLTNLDADTKDHLSGPIAKFYSVLASDEHSSFFDKIYRAGDQPKEFQVFRYYLNYLVKNGNPEITQQGVNNIVYLLGEVNNKPLNENISAAFKGMAGTKLEKASTENNSMIKQNLNKQAEIFNTGSQILLK